MRTWKVTPELSRAAETTATIVLWVAVFALTRLRRRLPAQPFRPEDCHDQLIPVSPAEQHVATRDPYALRGLVLILAVAAFFAAGGDRIKRIAAAFDWHGVVTPANYRIDAWVTPPAYTGRPPLILPGLRPGEQTQARANGPIGFGYATLVEAEEQ